MNAVRCGSTVSVVRTAFFVALAVLAVATPRDAWANPVPMGGLFFHVHPVDPQFCDQCPISECEQIVQHTTATGTLEFDLFVTHYYF